MVIANILLAEEGQWEIAQAFGWGQGTIRKKLSRNCGQGGQGGYKLPKPTRQPRSGRPV